MTSRHFRLTKRFLLPASLLLPLAGTVAADVFWDNPGTGLFNDGANWDTGIIPTSADNAFLVDGGTAQLGVDEVASVNTLRVQSGAVELESAVFSTGVTSSTWQSTGDMQIGGLAGMNGSLTASGTSDIVTGRVRVGGWNDGSDSSDIHGSLTMSGSSMMTITPPGFDFWLGNGAGSTGTLDMSGSSQIVIAGAGGTAGRAGGSATAVQSGTSRLESAGGFRFGEEGSADWTVSDEAVLQIGGNLELGTGNGASGTMTVTDAASVSAGDQLFVGNTANATAVLNIEGGTVTANSWIAIGRDEATATLNVSGGSLTKLGAGTHFVTNGEAGKVATINHTGGTITNTVSETQISERTQNVTNWTASGGVGNFGDLQVARAGIATVTISGTANYTATTVRLGVDGTASGVLNLDGGSLTANSVSEVAGSGTINFNGGTLRAGAANADFIAGFEPGDVVILAGGAVIDTNAFDVQITLALTGDGGLAKIGEGTLILSGANTYLGNTAVTGGVLSITSGFLSDSGNIFVEGVSGEGAVFDLDFDGTDTVNGLVINGEIMAVGTWGAEGSGATFESEFFSGNGILEVTAAVPEPSTVGLVTAGLGMAMWSLRRRRR